jgi:selenocysteine lyase/cysteine desulfurase
MSAKAAAPAPRALDSAAVRTHFPAIRPGGPVFFDNPAGTQECTESLERMRDYLLNRNANHGGAFSASRESDATVRDTRAAAAG